MKLVQSVLGLEFEDCLRVKTWLKMNKMLILNDEMTLYVFFLSIITDTLLFLQEHSSNET